jgi:uncharacterized protein YbjT (DUF2867 family)
MAHPRTIAVAGSTGFVGRHIVRSLLDRGHRVRALVRSRDKAARTLDLAATELALVQGDAADPADLTRLMDAADACINAVGIIREGPAGQTFRKLHVDVTRALVHACRAAGARRFLHVSALAVTDDADTAYQRSKFEAERILTRSDLDWTIFRPGLVHGPDGDFTRLAARWVRGRAAPWVFLPYFTRAEPAADVPLAAVNRADPSVQPIAVEDLAEVIAESIDRPGSIGEIYPLVGPEVLTWPQMLRFIRDSVPGADERLEPRGIPAETAARLAPVARIMGIAPLLPFDEGMARMGAQDATASSHKVRDHLGFDPRPFRTAFRAYASQL